MVEAHRSHAQTAHSRTLVRNPAKHLKPAFPGSLRAVKQSDAESYAEELGKTRAESTLAAL